MTIDPIVFIFALFPVAAIVFFLIQFARKGFKGAFFGGRIAKTHAEIPLTQKGWLKGRIKVHTIESKDGNHVGMEIIQNSFDTYNMTALTFTHEDIAKLSTALSEILAEQGSAHQPATRSVSNF